MSLQDTGRDEFLLKLTTAVYRVMTSRREGNILRRRAALHFSESAIASAESYSNEAEHCLPQVCEAKQLVGPRSLTLVPGCLALAFVDATSHVQKFALEDRWHYLFTAVSLLSASCVSGMLQRSCCLDGCIERTAA